MDEFVAWSNNGSLVQSYYDASSLPEGLLARQYLMCDRFFHAAFGGSFLNHQYLHCRSRAALAAAASRIEPEVRLHVPAEAGGFAAERQRPFLPRPLRRQHRAACGSPASEDGARRSIAARHQQRRSPEARLHADDRRSPGCGGHFLAVVLRRLERRRGRQAGQAVSIPPSTVCLLRQICPLPR